MPTLESSTKITVVQAATAPASPPIPSVSPLRALFAYFRRAYSLDLRSLALFRIGLACILLGDLFFRSFDLTSFYTDWGVLPRAALLDKFSPPDRFSIHLISGQPIFQIGLFLLAAFFAVMLLLGVKTRLATIASWFMLVSLQNRNLEILQGGDVYLRQLMFWAIFLPLGALYSVDSALNTAADSAPAPSRNRYSYFSVPGIALMLQVAFVYAFAVLLKSGPSWHQEHSAVYYALSIQQMSTPLGRFLLHFPKLLPWLTRGALVHEGTIPFLILMPVLVGPIRTCGVLAILILHLALGLSIRLGHFPWIAGIAALPLLPTWFWQTVIPESVRHRFAHAGDGLRLYYDELSPFFRKAAFVSRTLLMIPAAELLPLRESLPTWNEMREPRSWMVIEPNGRRRFAFDGFACLLSCSPLFGWLSSFFRVGAIAQLGELGWRRMESRGDKLSDLTMGLKFRPAKLRTSWIVNAFALIVIVYVFLWNLSSVTHRAFRPAQEKMGITLGLDQEWDMFSPYPLTYDGWYVIKGKLRDGSETNVLHPDQPVSLAQPKSIADQYKNERWRKYLMNLSLSEYADYRLYYARSFCRSWNTGRSQRDPNALISFDIIFMAHQNSLTRPPADFSPDLLWHHECFK